MTQQQFVQEFKTYPKAKKSVVIRQLLRIFEEDLEENTQNNSGVSNFDERQDAYQRLRGIASVAGKTPPSDEQVKEDFMDYLSEKHK